MNFLIKKSGLICRHASLFTRRRLFFSSGPTQGFLSAGSAATVTKKGYYDLFYAKTKINLEGMLTNLSNPQMVDFLMANKQLLPFMTDIKTVNQVNRYLT